MEINSSDPGTNHPTHEWEEATRQYWRLPSPKLIPRAEDGVEQSFADERSACIICQNNFRDTIVIPCGHFILCGDCAVELLRPNNNGCYLKCPVCKKFINSLHHVFV